MSVEIRCTSGYVSQQTINIFRTLYNSWETRILLSLIVDCVGPSSVLGYYKHLNIVCSLIWPQLFCNFYLFYISNVKIHSFTHLPLSIKPTASFYQTNSKLWKWRILIFGFGKNFNLIFLKADVMMSYNDQNKGGR